ARPDDPAVRDRRRRLPRALADGDRRGAPDGDRAAALGAAREARGAAFDRGRRVTDAMEMARRIVAHELADASAPEDVAAAIERLFRRLYGQLVRVIGPAGFQAIMRRSMHLARAREGELAIREIEWTETSLTLAGLAAAIEASGSERARRDAAILLEQLLSLLARLIGGSLSARILHREWPEIVPAPGERGAENED